MGNPETAWPFEGLQMFGYDLIMADPPWEFELRSEKGEGKSAQAHYDCMPIDEICAMPVGQLASSRCWLHLWTTAPTLRQAFRAMDAWGFEYVTTVAWRKLTKKGKPAMGTGYVARSLHENILIGRVGRPWCDKPLPSLFNGVRRGHSRKPEEIYPLLEDFMLNARRLDLFSRQSRPGWTNWGKEKTKFDGEAV